MPTNTKLTINTLSSATGKKVTNNISYVNPNITNAQAVTFGNMLTDLTKDEYQSTTRTDTTDCDTSITRPITEFTYTYSGSNPIAVPSNFIIDIPTSENLKILSIKLKTPLDSAPQVLNYSDNAESDTVGITNVTYGGEYGWSSYKGLWAIEIASSSDTSQRKVITPRTITFTLHFDATPNYDAYNQLITFNITAS